MKNTHFLTCLIAISLLCSLTSCRYERVYTYTVRNESGVPVKLKAYETRTSELKKTLILDHEEEHTEAYVSNLLPPERYYFSDYFNRADSLEVIYKNEKKEVFIDPDYLERPMINPLDSLTVSYMDTIRVKSEKNPLNIYFYQGQEVTFIFTEEDYENATDCGGDCE
jgi:hypothetical protein